METESSNPLFVYLSFQEGEVLLNLNQIVMVRDIGAEEITLEMSSGREITLHGSEPVARILGLLTEHAIIPEGVPLAESIAAKSKMH